VRGQNYRITRNTTSRMRVTTIDTAMEPRIPRRLEKNTNTGTLPFPVKRADRGGQAADGRDVCRWRQM